MTMCKAMMEQREAIEKALKVDLKRATDNIRKNGVCDAPRVLVDMEQLFIANRQYFKQQGFFFDSDTRIENGRVRYYAWLKLGGEGNLAETFWEKIREANEEFIIVQRKEIFQKLRDSQLSYIFVDMQKLLFDNKLFFEEHGFCFEPDTRIQDGTTVYLARMRKRC